MQNTQQHKEKGAALLLEMVIVLLIMGTILAAIPAPVIKLQQNKTESAAASALATVNFAEYSYMRAYGGFIGGGTQPLLPLSGVLNSTAQPCANPMMLPGLLANLPATNFQGYTMTFTGNGTAANFTCPGGPATAYTGYSISLDPTDSLSAHRHFFTCTGFGSCDGLIHFNNVQPAVQADPVYNTAVIGDAGAIGGSNGNNGSTGVNGTTSVQVWNPSANVTPGSTWILPSNDPAGGTCSPSNGSGYVGVFVALPTAVSGEDPCQPTSAADFLYSGNGTLTYVPAMPACGGVLTGSLGNFNIPFASGINIPWTGTSGTLVTITPPNACGNFTTFILQEQAGYTPGSGTENPAQFGMTESINQTSIGGCMQGNGVPVSYGTNAFNQCQSTWGSINLSRGDTLYLWVAGAPPSFSIQNLVWTLK